jgi:hypothetical protein
LFPALKVAESAFFEEFFVGLLSGFNISRAELEHAIDQAGEFVGSGIDSCRRSKTRFDASDESADGSLTLHGALGGQAQVSGSATLRSFAVCSKGLPPLIRLLGATLSHAQKCFSLGQRLISQTDFGEDPLHGQQVEPR